jgi:pimeloyl-ACP methyl ester carboxylesterase
MLHIARDVSEAIQSYDSIDAFRSRLAMTHPLGDAEVITRLAHTGVVRRRDGRFEPAIDPGVLGGSAEAEDLSVLERDLWEALARIQCPTLVVRGGLSAILDRDVARRMVEDVLVAGRLETLEKAGHGVMLDDGPGLQRCIEAFVARLDP